MWIPKKDIVWRKKEDMIVLLNTTTGHYYTVNQTAATLWNGLVGEGMSLDEAVEKIHREYDDAPSRSVIRQECIRQAEEWKSENLIEEKPSPKGI